MYREIIKFKENLEGATLSDVLSICIRAHINIAGKVDIKKISSRCFIFEGEEEDYQCLQLGYLALNKSPVFRSNIESWLWEDEDPSESCDILEEFAKVR